MPFKPPLWREYAPLLFASLSLPAVYCSAQAGPPRIALVPTPDTAVHAPASPDTIPTLTWVKTGDDTWKQGAPLFHLAGSKQAASATGWAAATTEGIRLYIVVQDSDHANHRDEAAIWDGDAIQIGLDLRGEGTGALPDDTVLVGPSDASLAFALTDKGPRAWAHYHGRPGGEGAMPQLQPRIARNETAKTTTYDLLLPWKEFQSAGGVFPQIGLAVQINDTIAGVAEQARLYWGQGAGGNVRPGAFHRLNIGPPPNDVAGAVVTRDALWQAGDAAVINVAVSSASAATAVATMGGETVRLPLPTPSAKGVVQRYAVQFRPAAEAAEETPFTVRVVSATNETLAQAEGKLHRPGQTFADLSRQIQTLLAQNPPSVEARMLHSVDALVQTQFLTTAPYRDEQPGMAADTTRYARLILAGLRGAAAHWNEYSEGRRALTLAFRGRDGALQPYQITLPADFKPETAYPLIINLHGAGNPDTLDFVSHAFAPEPAPVRAPDDVETQALVLAPWGRGNLGYRGLAEDDIFAALADARHWLNVDNNRIYLTGHSMGGAEAWALALRAPDTFAAVAINSGGTWNAPAGIGLGINAAHLPIRIHHGDRDGSVPVTEAYKMREELTRFHNPPVMDIVAGAGHEWTPQATRAAYAWLLTNRRKRPEAFTYVVDSNDHQGVWGVEIDRDAARDPLPRLECRIEGNTIRLTTKGTPYAHVVPGANGLGLTGNITLILNTKTVYTGPCVALNIDVDKSTATAE